MKKRKPRNHRADTELLGALWSADPKACARALVDGANPNGRQWDDDEHMPFWSALLRASGNPHRQVECLRLLMAAGLSLNGGGATVKRQTMLMRIEELDPMVAHALIEGFGPRRLRTRLAAQGPMESLDEALWEKHLAVFDARRLEDRLEKNTSPAPGKHRRPRL